jgi:Peptidase family M20/M25/M40
VSVRVSVRADAANPKPSTQCPRPRGAERGWTAGRAFRVKGSGSRVWATRQVESLGLGFRVWAGRQVKRLGLGFRVQSLGWTAGSSVPPGKRIASVCARTAAAKLLKAREAGLGGTAVLIFQPAEEVRRGAAQMLAGGVLDGVSAIFGLHVWPQLASGTIGFRVRVPCRQRGVCLDCYLSVCLAGFLSVCLSVWHHQLQGAGSSPAGHLP